MSDAQLAELAELAELAGISLDWIDADGRPQRVAPENQRTLLEALGFPARTPEQVQASIRHIQASGQAARPDPLYTLEQGQPLYLGHLFAVQTPYSLFLEDGRRFDRHLDESGHVAAILEWGYHRLSIGDYDLTLAVAPPACLGVDDLGENPRIWGLSAQLYSLRRPGDGGLGDTGALEELVRHAAGKGADAIAISPVHAMFGAYREQYSPYSPSSRLFFNVLHAAPATLFGQEAVDQAIAECGLEGELSRLEALPLVDWPAVNQTRTRILRQLYRRFHDAPDFLLFRRDGGDALEQHCRFEALHGAMVDSGQPGDWRLWPEHLRDPQHQAVQLFAAEHAEEVAFHAFGQWLAARCLAHAQTTAREAGMRIGLIADLAVGADATGSQAWARQTELLPSVAVGAPPDILNRSGQNWGVSAFSPVGLRQNGFRAYIEMLRANLAHAGGIRIDHVMGLKRLWVIPKGAHTSNGAYLNYPLDDLLRLLALESWRNRALVIGEDLGTVPEGLREELGRRKLLGMRILFFEQSHGRFTPPRDWSGEALATSTTHDLPSIKGWHLGRDIDWRQRLGLRTQEQTASDRQHREHEKHLLAQALRDNGQIADTEADLEQRTDACVGYIGMTPAPLVLLPLEDALGAEEQPNLPAEGNEHPNWRRRWKENAGEMLDTPQAQRRLQRLDASRRAQGSGQHG